MSYTKTIRQLLWNNNRGIFGAILLLGTYANVDAQDITITYSGDKAKIESSIKDSVKVKTAGARVEITSTYASRQLNILLKGESKNGALVLKSDGKARITLNNLSLTSEEGAPLWLKNNKKVEIVAQDNTSNNLTISECNDTAAYKAAVIWAKGKVAFTGKGTLNATAKGNGCKGINAKKDITISDLTLNIITEGNNLGKKEMSFPGFGGAPGGMGMPDFNNIPDSIKAKIEKMMKEGPFAGGMPNFNGGAMPNFGAMPEGQQMPQFAEGGMPNFGGGKMPNFGGGMPNFGGGMASGDPDETVKGGFKQKYESTTKAIRSMGVITINSGNVYCKTVSAGAEGIEGKKGVTINGGEVVIDANDDAINSGGVIAFYGGKVIAESHCNDAVDSNMGGFAPFGPFGANGKENNENTQKPAIIIAGGEIYPWSHVGAPEEGLDCDSAPIEISGGRVFTIGGAIGDHPSSPSQQSAKQPTILIKGITLKKGELLEILEGDKVVFSQKVPFAFLNSFSLITSPELTRGKSYTLRTTTTNQSFILADNFTTLTIVMIKK